MSLIVQKFGGTSLANIERIEKVANIIVQAISKGQRPVVIVSAMAGSTNSLISKCHEVSALNSSENMREYDAIVSSGEIATAALLALKLQNLGFKATSLQGWQVPIVTDDKYGEALVNKIEINILQKIIADQVIPIITGFQGVTSNGRVTTLGRGGSDSSALLIASALSANRCDIYTDVDGVFSADPRIVHKARKIDQISQQEMLALCSNGAKVLHPRAALAGYRYNIDIRILSSFNDNPGTIISSNNNHMENGFITAITSNKNLTQIDITKAPDFSLSELIKNFTIHALQIQHLNIYEDKIRIITNLGDQKEFDKVLHSMQKAKFITDFMINHDISTVTLVGYAIKSDINLTHKILESLTENDIKIAAVFAGEIQLSLLLAERDTEKATQLLHSIFIAS